MADSAAFFADAALRHRSRRLQAQRGACSGSLRKWSSGWNLASGASLASANPSLQFVFRAVFGFGNSSSQYRRPVAELPCL